jgi:hypothetical protein
MISRLRAGVPLSALAATLLASFALDNILLLAFLGLPPLFTIALIALACPLVAWAVRRMIKSDVIVPWRAIVVAAFVVLALFLLGGQGRLFYANADWQVRDAILADMARHPWPFAYRLPDYEAILRAPIGLYLLPSLAGGGWHEAAMFLSNTVRLTLLLAICYPLFTQRRACLIALAIFILFSGLDIVGTMAFDRMGVAVTWDHIERWNFNNQFSAHITQAFWVPQHAIAGWSCAVGFLLWHRGLARIGVFAAIIPLVAIWSPLAIMGAIPFALAAGVKALVTRDWNRRDVVLAFVATAIALPALAYLKADAAELGSGARLIGLLPYLFLITLEVLPFTLPLLLARSMAGPDRAIVWIILACLLLTPLYQIGTNSDFQMRASIMPLALLAFFFAQWAAQLADSWRSSRPALLFVTLLVAAGAITPFKEVQRALIFAPSPEPLCSLAGVWHRQQGLQVAPYASYFARADSLPRILGPVPVLAGTDDPVRCWSGRWAVPR